MKRPTEERERWLKQAVHTLAVAQEQVRMGRFAEACFSAEQAAQTVLKAYLYGKGERVVLEHSIPALLARAAAFDRTFSALKEGGGVLDRYYLATRYPDALAPPAVPYESFSKDEAVAAVALAERIFQRVQGAVE